MLANRSFMFFPWSSLLDCLDCFAKKYWFDLTDLDCFAKKISYCYVIDLSARVDVCDLTGLLFWSFWYLWPFVTTRSFFRMHSLCEHLTFFPPLPLPCPLSLFTLPLLRRFSALTFTGHNHFVCDFKVDLDNSKKINYLCP